MLEWLGKYFVSIAAAGLLSTFAPVCVPETGKTVVKFAGGLLVVLAVLLPLKNIDALDVSEAISQYRSKYESSIIMSQDKTAQSAADMLERLARDDILEYASKLGASCEVRVLALKSVDGGVRLYSATVEHLGSEAAVEQIAEYIEKLGIPRERQQHLIKKE